MSAYVWHGSREGPFLGTSLRSQPSRLQSKGGASEPLAPSSQRRPLRNIRVKDILLKYEWTGGCALGLARTGALNLAPPAGGKQPSPAAEVSDEAEEIEGDDYEEEDDDDEPAAPPPKEGVARGGI